MTVRRRQGAGLWSFLWRPRADGEADLRTRRGARKILELPVSCSLFRHAHGNLLSDTGRHRNAAENPEALWGSWRARWFRRATMS